jgi:AraC-like DNA-binding protein
MGAITHASHSPGGDRAAMIGVYLGPRGVSELLGIPGSDVTDRVVRLDDIWHGLAHEAECASLDSVESLLLRRIRNRLPKQRTSLVAAMTAYVRRQQGRVTVAALSEQSGFSRQHLRRLFREQVGVGPKLYARLARLRAGLALLAQREPPIGWSRLSAQLGYADQSHFIADFREFTSFTPEQLACGACFHPFIGDRTFGGEMAVNLR